MMCSNCSSQMKPLFTGFFCPNGCDRKCAAKKDTTFSVYVDGEEFTALVLDRNDPVPDHAEYGWYASFPDPDKFRSMIKGKRVTHPTGWPIDRMLVDDRFHERKTRKGTLIVSWRKR